MHSKSFGEVSGRFGEVRGGTFFAQPLHICAPPGVVTQSMGLCDFRRFLMLFAWFVLFSAFLCVFLADFGDFGAFLVFLIASCDLDDFGEIVVFVCFGCDFDCFL